MVNQHEKSHVMLKAHHILFLPGASHRGMWPCGAVAAGPRLDDAITGARWKPARRGFESTILMGLEWFWDFNGILTGYNGIEWDFGGTLRYFHWEHFRKIGDRSSTDVNCVILSMNLVNIIRKTMGIAHHQSASDRACLSQLFSICLICGLEDSPNQPSYSKD